MPKLRKLSFDRAYAIYKQAYPLDNYTSLAHFEKYPEEREALRTEITAMLNAPLLEDACKLAQKYDYGCMGDPDCWESYREDMALLRRAGGINEDHYDELAPRSIVKDLVSLVTFISGVEELSHYKHLDKRIEKVYGRIWEEKE